jgi:hypothetical protein
VANAVNFVNATYSTPRGHALVGSRLWIPAEHVADEQLRDQMGIPTDLEFKTKPELGQEILAEHVDAGIDVGWCTADAVYGRDRKLREYCEGNDIGYVLGVPCSFRVTPNSATTLRVDATLKLLGRQAWQVASCGPGSKGERRYAFAWLSTTSPRHFLLIRRSLAKPAEVAYFYCYVPEHRPATLGVLVAVAGRSWTVEEDHEFGKDQFGFDQSQARLFTPIMRHIVLVMAALAVCAITTAQARTGAASPPTPTSPTEPPPDQPGPHPAHRGRGQTPIQPAHRRLARHRPSPVLVLVATPTPSPRPLVPPPRPTHMIKSRSTAALLDTLTARANLADTYRQAGRTNDAITLLEQVVADSERLLGAEHPHTVAAKEASRMWKARH